MPDNKLKSEIKSEASKLGFVACGFSKAGFLDEEAPRLEKFLKNGQHGEMRYLENYFDKRLDPSLLVDGAKTVISFLFNYFPAREQGPNAPIIAKYAYGNDYHYVVKEKLLSLIGFIRDRVGEVSARAFVDSAPVLEKAWAQKSGLGWMGKNTCLINKSAGSFFFLGEIIIDVAFPYDSPANNYCGTCTKCLDACPTGALSSPGIMDARKCLSYLTIEYRGEFPVELRNKFHNRVFGCDICQDICPWNKQLVSHNCKALEPLPGLLEMQKQDFMEFTSSRFKKYFKLSPISRIRFQQWQRNLSGS